MSECRVHDCGAITDGFICSSCAGELKVAIKALPGLMHEVSVFATGQARVYRRNGRPILSDDELADLEEEYAWRLARIPAHLRSRDGRVTLPATRAMVNLAARRELDAAWTVLTTWARHLAESRGAEVPLATRPSVVADWLADRVNSIRFDEAAAQAFTDLTTLRENLARMVDRAPSRVYAGPCHVDYEDGGRCDRPLYAWFTVWQRSRDEADDDRVVDCDGYRPPSDPKWDPADEGCGAEHTPADRIDWLLAELEDRLEPIDFWQFWLPKLRADLTFPMRTTWVRWVERGSLLAKTITPDAVELFRGGDVTDLVEREQARILGNLARARRSRDALSSAC